MTDEPKNLKKSEAENAIEAGAAEVAEGLETLDVAAGMAAVSAAELAAGAGGMHSRIKQRLVGVNVADPGHDRLIQQQRLDGRLATADPPVPLRETHLHHVRTDMRQGRRRLLGVTRLEGPQGNFFVRNDQINCQVPFEVAGKANTMAVVSFAGASSSTVSVSSPTCTFVPTDRCDASSFRVL